MKLLLIAALLGIALANDCPTYIKKGCLKQNRQVYHQQVANNRDASSNVYTKKHLDWGNYQNSLKELGCDCAKKVKELGGVGFAMGFYGECWMATDQSELEKSLIDINQQSSKCIGHDYQTCNSEHENCMGGAESQFVYGFPSAAPPAVDGAPGNWSEWTPCTKTCGNGFKERERSCNSPVASNGGKDCESEELTETQSCKIVDCPVNGNWSDWSDYENCPASCGGSSHKRTRSCTNPAPAHGGEECHGSDEESKSCGTISCPVNGAWSDWSDYENCPVSCGGSSHKRTRSCTNPAPAHGGEECQGSDEGSKSCGTSPCPIDGQWSSWGSYGQCSKTCGPAGQYTRSRSCSAPAPANGGALCSGDAVQTSSCNQIECPINGQWSSWGSYGQCSKTCGPAGQYTRSRSCSSPAPSFGGDSCQGNAVQTSSCNVKNCPVNAQWSNWSGYSTCSKTCATGSQSRSRTCSGGNYGGSTSCSGSKRQSRNCNANVRCPYTTGEYTSRICEGGKTTIKCNDPHQTIQLTNYFWGRTTKSVCQGGIDWTWSTNCRGGHGRIRGRCNGRNSCNLEANNNWMNDDPCWGTPKYAEVKYKCTG